MSSLPLILVDADACPVKDEVYRVAKRYSLDVKLVSNAYIRAPREDWLEVVAVSGEPDAADDWIAEASAPDALVVTADIPLAARCVEKGARVLTPRGRVLDATAIGDALATRNLMTHLRELGEETGGPSSFTGRDRSEFLQRLDEMINRMRRERP